MTIVFVHLSCQGLHSLPEALKSQKGTALLKPLANAVLAEMGLSIKINSPGFLVIYLPTDFPLSKASQLT